MSKESLITPMICKMCGAPLKGCECEYCGTRYYIPNNDALAQTQQELSQAQFDVANRVKLNEIQNMVDQLRMLGGNGSIEHMLSSGAVNIATARDMYAVKMASCFSNYGELL